MFDVHSTPHLTVVEFELLGSRSSLGCIRFEGFACVYVALGAFGRAVTFLDQQQRHLRIRNYQEERAAYDGKK